MLIDIAPYGYLELAFLIRMVMFTVFFFILGIIVIRAQYPLSRFERSLGWFGLAVSAFCGYLVGLWLYVYFFTPIVLI